MTANIDFGLANIEQIALPVQDLDRAVDFYRSKLGMKYLFSSNGLAFFDCAGIRLLLSNPESRDTPRYASVLYFNVPDIHRAHKILLERGVSFIDAPHLIADMGDYELWMAFFEDSEQNMLAITGHIRR